MRKGKTMQLKQWASVAALLMLGTTACGAIEWRVHANQRLEHGSKNVTRANTNFYSDNKDNQVKPFVGVAISGGGSRSANFSAAVLWELERLGFLRHVTAISSVSGGSLTAAYYGLFKHDPKRWNWKNMKKDMRTNFFSKFAWSYFLPHTWLLTKFTTYDRSNVMAEVFDEVLFENKTFSNWGQGLPRILINVTSLEWDIKTMTDDTFNSLNSNSLSYPISHAVMASGAFPGAFNNVTLKDFSHPTFLFLDEDIKDPVALGQKLSKQSDPLSEFIWRNCTDKQRKELESALEHLTVDELLHYEKLRRVLSNTFYFFMENSDGGKQKGFYDLFSDRMLKRLALPLETQTFLKDNPESWDAEPRFRLLLETFYQEEINSSKPRYVHFFDGGPLDNLGTHKLLDTVKSYPHSPPPSDGRKSCFLFLIDSSNMDPEESFTGEFNADMRNPLDFIVDSNVLRATDYMLRASRFNNLGRNFRIEISDLSYDASLQESTTMETYNHIEFTCLTWHISFESLQRLSNYRHASSQMFDMSVEEKQAIDISLKQLDSVIQMIETHYKLTGPENCTAEEIQDAIYDAAYLLVTEDRYALDKTYEWFRSKFKSEEEKFMSPASYRKNHKISLQASEESSCAYRHNVRIERTGNPQIESLIEFLGM